MNTQAGPGTEPNGRLLPLLQLGRSWEPAMAQQVNGQRMAQGLGWLSLGLGVAGLAAPGTVARLIGVPDDDSNRDLVRALGLREIACGVGILTAEQPAGWLWTRVGGDAIDLGLLGVSLKGSRSDRRRVTAAMAAVAGITAADAWCATQVSGQPGQPIELRQSVTIDRRPDEVYTFWRDLRNLPRFLSHLEAVEVTDERRSHWQAKGPAGVSVEWDAEITVERPNELLAWRSLEGADVPNAGEVRFEPAPAGRGTVVRVEMRYQPPGGRAGAAVAKLFGREPGQEIRADLRQLKQVLETGEVSRPEASIHPGPHPARPPEQPRV